MKYFRITENDKAPYVVPATEIAIYAARRQCERFDWVFNGKEFTYLSNPDHLSEEFLLTKAKEKYPNSVVETL